MLISTARFNILNKPEARICNRCRQFQDVIDTGDIIDTICGVCGSGTLYTLPEAVEKAILHLTEEEYQEIEIRNEGASVSTRIQVKAKTREEARLIAQMYMAGMKIGAEIRQEGKEVVRKEDITWRIDHLGPASGYKII